MRPRHPAGDHRVQQAKPRAQAADSHRPQHRRGGGGSRRHLRRRGQRGRQGRRQGEGRRGPRLGDRPPACRAHRGDEVRLPRSLQAQGLPRPMAAARGHAGRGQGDAARAGVCRRLRRPRAGARRHPHGPRPCRHRQRILRVSDGSAGNRSHAARDRDGTRSCGQGLDRAQRAVPGE